MITERILSMPLYYLKSKKLCVNDILILSLVSASNTNSINILTGCELLASILLVYLLLMQCIGRFKQTLHCQLTFRLYVAFIGRTKASAMSANLEECTSNADAPNKIVL